MKGTDVGRFAVSHLEHTPGVGVEMRQVCPPVPALTVSILCRSEFADTILSVHPSDVLDMPVDPNEPTYCLCHQVSYGEMIGCDNPDVSVGLLPGALWGSGGGTSAEHGSSSPQCPIEWFHFACVDLTTKPKGKWSVWLPSRWPLVSLSLRSVLDLPQCP